MIEVIVPERKERCEMWANFFWACKLGTVLQAADRVIWQKRGKFVWQMIGSNGEYSPDSIAWPAEIILEGVG